MTSEEREIAEIQRLKDAVKKSSSTKLKNDYIKAIKRKTKMLMAYRKYREEANALQKKTQTD